MATQAPPKASATAQQNTETAVQAWQPQTSTLLQQYPEERFNVLVPTQGIRQVNPYLVPDIETVKLSMDESKGEIYHDSQMKQGFYAPTAKGLSRIRQVAGIDEIDSRRTDNGSDPDVVEWTVVIEMTLPSGQRVRGHGSKRIDIKAMTFASDAHRQRTRQFMLENAQTKALNRAIRSLLSLHGSMPKAEFAKPFAILRWVPNMSDPDVRRRMLDNLLPATTAVYGEAPRQVGAGDDVIEADPIADDDEPAEGQFVDIQTNGTAHVDTSTGEIVSETPAPDEPDWFGDDAEPAGPSLVDRLKAAGKANGDKGPAGNEQKIALKSLLPGSQFSADRVIAVLRQGLGFKGDTLSAITAGQAAAILAVADEIGADELRRQWLAATES
jgi:hypothetical protein